MQVKPRIRGYICTTAHPQGCAQNVSEQISYIRDGEPIVGARNVIVLGCSGGYGLASRISAAFGCGAKTLGVSYEKEPTEKRPGSSGWYNNLTFDRIAKKEGLYAKTIDGDAFSEKTKEKVVDIARREMEPIDLLIYSLASPVRQHPKTGKLHRSVIKPLGSSFESRTLDLNLNTGDARVVDVTIDPADSKEAEETVAVMGGEDWQFWVETLSEAGVLAQNFKTVAYTYIGNELTWPIYWDGTLGKAKEDLDRTSKQIQVQLEKGGLNCEARVAVLKAVVTQASTAIPVVPLYFSILFKVMKQQGTHENCIQHIHRLFQEELYGTKEKRLDEKGRIRMDNHELDEQVQAAVSEAWSSIDSSNVKALADIEGFRSDFMRIFGFGIENVDYDADQDLGSKELSTTVTT